MASPAVRMSRSLCRSWALPLVSGVLRSVGGASNVLQHRHYSDEEIKGSVPEEVNISEQLLDSPDSVPSTETKPVKGRSRRSESTTVGSYPPRNPRTPRGVYKAILLGEVENLPIQKILKSGKLVTILTIGTGGMYNNRKPFDGESPEEFARKSYTQLHRVSVYQDRVAGLVMQHVKIGSQVYLEGNIETRVFTDPNSGSVKRIREIAVRANGRLMFMDTPKAIIVKEAAAVTTSDASATG